MKTATKVPSRVLYALKGLRRLGYFAKWKHKCCQGCGCTALPEGTTAYVFAHAQDVQGWYRNGTAYLSWAGNGNEIMTVLTAAGLFPVWDGKDSIRIQIRRDAPVEVSA